MKRNNSSMCAGEVAVMVNRKRSLLPDPIVDCKKTRLEKLFTYNEVQKWTLGIKRLFDDLNAQHCNNTKTIPNLSRQQYIFLHALKAKMNDENTNSSLIEYINVCLKPNRLSLGNIRELSLGGERSTRQGALRAHILNSLKFRGFCVLDKFFGEENALGVEADFDQLWQKDKFDSPQLMGGSKSNARGRTDKVCWVDGGEEGGHNVRKLLNFTDKIIAGDKGSFDSYTITAGTKAMMTCYPGEGSNYKLHVDNATRDGRCITCTYFLNQNWDSQQNGGNLRILARTCGKSAEIEPKIDRVVFFYSDHRNPHVVLPTFAMRKSITFWYFDNEERLEALKKMC